MFIVKVQSQNTLDYVMMMSVLVGVCGYDIFRSVKGNDLQSHLMGWDEQKYDRYTDLKMESINLVGLVQWWTSGRFLSNSIQSTDQSERSIREKSDSSSRQFSLCDRRTSGIKKSINTTTSNHYFFKTCLATFADEISGVVHEAQLLTNFIVHGVILGELIDA